MSTAKSPAEPALSTSSRQVAHRLSTGARSPRSPAPPGVEWEKQFEAHQAPANPTRASLRPRCSTTSLRADGLSYNEITARLCVSKSSVSLWVRDLPGPPHRQHCSVVFINSDPGLIGLFLRFLDAAGISRSDLVFTVCIRESGDVAAACRFWLEVTKASPKQFNKVSLKRHNPRTTRKNIGEGYHGCLRITVHRSSDLYRKIEGWAAAAMTGPVLSTRSA